MVFLQEGWIEVKTWDTLEMKVADCKISEESQQNEIFTSESVLLTVSRNFCIVYSMT